jgi:glycerate kinase
MTVFIAPDKFRGTATSREIVEAVTERCHERGVPTDAQVMSDGGEGFRSAFPGDTKSFRVSDPWGTPVIVEITTFVSPWGRLGVFEMAEVIGRHIVTHPTGEQALQASSAGVGELIREAQSLQLDGLLVGCGGTASSDGGAGCYDVLRSEALTIPMTVATDVTTSFSGAVSFAEQKGVRQEDLQLVAKRLTELRELYQRERGIDVEMLDRAGAGGGVPGALAALGAQLVSGFDAVASNVHLLDRLKKAELVVTGEGRFDHGSLEGKVVSGVVRLADPSTPVLVICGSVDDKAKEIFLCQHSNVQVVSLEDRFGTLKAHEQTAQCVADVVDAIMKQLEIV